MDEPRTQSEPAPPEKRKRLVRLTAFPAILLAGGLTYVWWPGDPPPPAEPKSETTGIDADDPEAAARAAEDKRMTKAIIGRWETDRSSGHRELIMREDGTALMSCDIDPWVQRLAFGPHMDIDIEWHIENGILHMNLVGGQPQKSVDRLKTVGGESLAYPILEITENRLLVKDGEDDPDHDWSRMKE